MAIIKGQDTQTIYDIALQTSGGLDAVVAMAVLNPNLPTLNYKELSGIPIVYTPSADAIPQCFTGGMKTVNGKYPVTVLTGDFNDDYNNDYLS